MRPPSPRGQFGSRRSFMPGELAVLLRVDVRTLRGWAEHGQISCVVTRGKHRRYYRPRLPMLPPDGDPQLLTIREAAAELGVHPDTISRAIGCRALYSVGLPGGGRRLWRQDIDAGKKSGLQ